MWRKMFREHQNLTYRKKYKCSECNEYSLNIEYDLELQCENGCDLSDFDEADIADIISNNDFKGYYIAEELNELFYKLDYNEMNRNFGLGKITDDPLLKGMSKRQKNEIEWFFEKSIEIDSKLDDVTVKYMNANNIKENSELTPFSYVIHLVEDMHHFLYLAWNEICLFYCASNLSEKKFYTERFFFDNCVDHISFVVDRMYVFLGIYYDYSFKDELSKNTTDRIKSDIKCTEYKSSDIKRLIDTAGGLFPISRVRGSNNHDISYVNSEMYKSIEKDNSKIKDYDKDSSEIYIKDLTPKLDSLIKIIRIYYDVLDEIVKMIDDNNFREKHIPMLRIFWNDILKSEAIQTQYTSEYFENINLELRNIFENIYFLNNKYTLDIFFRMDEIIKCINDIYNRSYCEQFINNSFNGMNMYYIGKYNIDPIKNKFTGQIDEQYLLYSSVTRLYSCYDKLSKYLNNVDDRYKDIKYFSDFNKISLDSENDFDKKILAVINNEFYKKLEKFRNNIYHSLRPGCFGGKGAMAHFNTVISQIVFENTKIMLDFLKFIIDVNMCRYKKINE